MADALGAFVPGPRVQSAGAAIGPLVGLGENAFDGTPLNTVAGHKQVSIPGSRIDGLWIGLSIIGARSSGASLVAVAKARETAS